MAAKSSPSTEKAPFGVSLSALLVLIFLHAPILVIFLYAFTTDEAGYTFPLPGLTLQWFGIALQRTDFWEALWLSVRVALMATGAALVLGTLVAAAVHRSRFFGREVISLALLLPIALPGIVTGIALRSTMGMLARFRRTAWSQVEASMDLGANGFQTFRHILLPYLGTAMLAGGVLAFALSFDEIIVTTFTAGQQQTLPIWIFSQLFRPRARPVTNVVAILVVLATALPILYAHRITQRADDTMGSSN